MRPTDKSIISFIGKFIALALPVITIFVICYLNTDPFRVIKKYDVLFQSYDESPLRIGLNKGWVTVENFKNLKESGEDYNTFIFGSSISIYYDTDTLSSLINDSIPLKTIHFDSSSESLQSMAKKIVYLNRQNVELRHALIVLDPIILECNESFSPAAIDHPDIVDNPLHIIRFHYAFFRASTNADFLRSWIPANIYGTPILNGRNPIFRKQPSVYKSKSNQEIFPLLDEFIKCSPDSFYRAVQLPPPPKDITEGKALINKEKEEALKTISEIFKSHNTDYEIIISPNRRKVILNHDDFNTLKKYFDSSRIHDFSLVHVNDLEVDTLLYDSYHYRPIYANKLMHEVYDMRQSEICSISD